ncbi:MAG: BatA domain-containing protein [Planctomycetia bacterium]|nr:BatA domain-containing protein [Planctomycetia bacterium]
MHPLLLAGGGLLVSVPIIIHLLNKRKFKIVDWAAMDFLFDADKRNRRRVRLEDLIILLLRTLAVLLIVLLLARPFLPGAAAAGWRGTISHERIVLLDDSPSMGAKAGNETPFDEARRVLAELVRDMGNRGSTDTLTLLVTSHPRKPIVNEAAVSPQTVDRLVAEIAGLKVSSRPARMEASLAEAERLLTSRSSNLNRLLYIVTDLRQRDWPTAAKAADTPGPAALLRRIADKSAGCYLVDVGSPQSDNLAITAVTPQDKVLAAGMNCRFEVTVRNFGKSDATNVDVRLTAEGSLPLDGRLDRIPAGQSASLPFNFTFARSRGGSSEVLPEAVAIRAELVTPAGATFDRLAGDNVRYFPARVVHGIRTLIVDGDPTSDPRRAESFFLRRGLAPSGDTPSGIVPRVATPAEFETLDLDPFQVIYLLNIDRLSDSRRESLDRWVKAGGGLVIALGDQLADVGAFNSQFGRQGQGLLSAEINEMRGDERERKWASINIVEKGHAVVGIFEGENTMFLEGVKVFRWWRTNVPEEAIRAGRVRILAKLTDPDGSPAILEQKVGDRDGRVILLTTPLDADWSNWPQDPSYLLFVQYLTRYLARSNASAGMVEVGQAITTPLDLVQYKLDVTLTDPAGDRSGLQPVQSTATTDTTAGANTAPAQKKPEPAADGKSPPKSSESPWFVSSPETETAGFYRLELARNDGGSDTLLFAANIDPNEGDLTPADSGQLSQGFGDSKVHIVNGQSLMALGTDGAKSELWLVMLCALGVVLGSEQGLALFFGRKR